MFGLISFHFSSGISHLNEFYVAMSKRLDDLSSRLKRIGGAKLRFREEEKG